MHIFFSFLIKNKYLVIAIFLIICTLGVLGIGLVDTSFDMDTFMPEGANSIAGLKIEAEEFGAATSTYILLEDKENWYTLELIERIERVDGVDCVDWLGDTVDVYTPDRFLSPQALAKYQEGNASLLIVVFESGRAQSVIDKAIGQISALMNSGEYYGGRPVILVEQRTLLNSEQPIYLAIAGGILIALLAISLSSYIAPLLCIINIGIAILINYGTNFIVKDEVSFLTVAIAAIFQMAVSMDYSIFLIHRFEEDLSATGGDVEASMVSSMRSTLTAISSSAITDCAGFAALIFMHNQIGADLGIVLSKGVLISLIVSITFLPCLMIATYKIGKRRHRVLLPSFKKLSKPLVKYRFVLIALVIILLVPALIGNGQQEYYYTTERLMPDDAPSVVTTNKIGETFGATDTVNVIYQKDMAVFEQAAISNISGLQYIREVQGIFDHADIGVPQSFLPDQLKDAYIGDDYRRFTVTLERDLNNDELFGTIDNIRETAGTYLGEVYVTGSYASAADMASTAEWDNIVVEFIAMAFIFVILLIAYRSLLIPVFLVLVIKAAIYINLGASYFTGNELIFLTPVLVGSIQLGATVDYAILFTSRYFEMRHKILDARQAVEQTIKAAARPMLTSVLTFFFSTLSITLISTNKAAREIAMVVGRGALISFLVIMFALPTLFILFDKPLMMTTLAFRRQFYHRNKDLKRIK